MCGTASATWCSLPPRRSTETRDASPIEETFPIRPVNPYGESKVMVERLLHWFDEVHRLTSVCLRYFNASGADPEGRTRRGARAGDPPDPADPARRQDRRADHGLRRRLPDARRHLHPRLHPRERPGAGPHPGGRAPAERRRIRPVQRRHRNRPQRAGGDPRGGRGYRPQGALRLRPAPRRRSARPGGRVGKTAHAAWAGPRATRTSQTIVDHAWKFAASR